MSTAKQEVRLLLELDQIPDDATFEDIQYHIYVREKIQRGIQDVEQGRVVSEEEMERRGVALILDIDLKLREQPSVADEVSIL